MRAILVMSLFALFCPAAAMAQAPSPTAPPSTPPAAAGPAGGVTRDQFIERAIERARHNAETRFDQMDTNHDGVLTPDERRAARALRGAAPPPK